MRKEFGNGKDAEGVEGAGARSFACSVVLVQNEARMRAGAGDDGVRDSSGGARRHCDHRHHGVSSEASRALERHRRRHQQLVAGDAGQATVEYVLLLAVFLCVMVALGMLAQRLDAGMFVDHALSSASHHVQMSAGWLADVFSF